MADKEQEFPAVVHAVYDLLISNRFERWYENDFMDHITGEEGEKGQKEILKDIQSLLRL